MQVTEFLKGFSSLRSQVIIREVEAREWYYRHVLCLVR